MNDTIEQDLRNLIRISRANGIAYSVFKVAEANDRADQAEEALELMTKTGEKVENVLYHILTRIDNGE